MSDILVERSIIPISVYWLKVVHGPLSPFRFFQKLSTSISVTTILYTMLRPRRTVVIKDRLVERLILEDNLERTFFQCTLFLVGFVLFLSLVHMATPTELILPIHEMIANQ